MGASQSAPTDSQPEVVRINRDEIPEQYRTVGVSSEVVHRVSAQQNTASPANSEESQKLKSELARERAEKARLREEMAQLTALQARRPSAGTGSSFSDDIEERKKIFDDAVQRVEKQFFAYQRENVCSENEQQIMECLRKSNGKVLKCAQLGEIYEKCVGDFRSQVLSGN